MIGFKHRAPQATGDLSRHVARSSSHREELQRNLGSPPLMLACCNASMGGWKAGGTFINVHEVPRSTHLEANWKEESSSLPLVLASSAGASCALRVQRSTAMTHPEGDSAVPAPC